MVYLVKKLATLVILLLSGESLSVLTDSAQQPSPKDIAKLTLPATGTESVIDAPEGIITVSVFTGKIGGLELCDNAIEGGLDIEADVVGTICCEAIASCSKHRTSSADARSTGACPSWFLRKGSAP